MKIFSPNAVSLQPAGSFHSKLVGGMHPAASSYVPSVSGTTFTAPHIRHTNSLGGLSVSRSEPQLWHFSVTIFQSPYFLIRALLAVLSGCIEAFRRRIRISSHSKSAYSRLCSRSSQKSMSISASRIDNFRIHFRRRLYVVVYAHRKHPDLCASIDDLVPGSDSHRTV